MESPTRKKRTSTHDHLLVPQHHLTMEIRKQRLTTRPAPGQDPILHLQLAQSLREEVDQVVLLTTQVNFNKILVV